MNDELPNEFDLIVVGTGFSESIVAAAASRIGKSVLHLDPNEFYGGVWASFNLVSFQEFLNRTSNHNSNETETSKLIDSDIDFRITENNCGITGVKHEWNLKAFQFNEESEENYCNKTNETDSKCDILPNTDNSDDSEKVKELENDVLTTKKTENESFIWTKEKILENSRRFSIDLIPKILFSNGKLVNLLITSNICRYAEFRAIDKVCTIFQNHIESIPCTRKDVFNSSDLSIIEKRLLMKLLTNCMQYNNDESKNDNLNNDFQLYEGKTFLEYLKGQKLTDKMIHCVLHAISMSNENTSLADGLERTKKFLSGLGRYGNTPFLFPMYGCGELPQTFCRLCAVFGGVYCLKKTINGIKLEQNNDKALLEKNTISSIICDNQEIKTKNLVIGSSNIPDCLKKSKKFDIKQNSNNCGNIARAIFITSIPIGNEKLNSGGGGVNVIKLPGIEKNSDGVFVIQLSHYSGTCPKGLYLIHVIGKSQSNSSENDLKPYISQIFNEIDYNSKVFYSAYFIIPECKNCSNMELLEFSNIHKTCGPFYELDYDKSIANAYDIFQKLYANEEFLPRAPDSEEIVIVGEDNDAQNETKDTEENEKIEISEN